MNIGIAGCGLIGKKRAASFDHDDRIVLAYDVNGASLQDFCAQNSCEPAVSWETLVNDPRIEAVVICVFHKALAQITLGALKAGKHVLVEKPAARNARELAPVTEFLDSMPPSGRPTAKCGFNHRFHPAFQKARSILDAEDFGRLMFIRGRYGHGGRPGYEKEWRADPEISGGGELLDQGMHLIDLSRWFLGDFSRIQGLARTFYWDMPVDDNAFLLLETPASQVAQLHVSWTEWKNLFSFEIYAERAKLHIEGLGGSYGTERLTVYRMKPEMGPPDTEVFEYPGPDNSWKLEWRNFKNAALAGGAVCGSIHDALHSLQIVEKIYELKP
jgi:predicted dehydrogenase